MKALASLGRAPDSSEVHALREECLTYLSAAKGWTRRPPTLDRDALSRKVSALHVAIARLPREP
jgi:hypothetical protein